MSLKISRILHAGYLFEFAGTQIVFDPIFENPFSRNCYAFPDVTFDLVQIQELKLDAVFISHFHDDHCSLESLTLLNKEIPIYLFCLHEELFTMIRELGFQRVHPLALGVPISIGEICVTPLRALDADVDSMFHVQAAGVNILNVVDSWIDPDMLEALAKNAWDMVLWPFQALREIEVLAPRRNLPTAIEIPSEWLEQLTALNPKFIIPSSCQFRHESWSWYNHSLFAISYQQFRAALKTTLPNAKVIRLDPSLSIALDANAVQMVTPLTWVKPVGALAVDYQFRGDMTPLSTAEIAGRFPRLSPQERERAIDYCRSGLLEKFKAIGGSADPYFAKPRLWKLAVVEHDGQRTEFQYRLIDDHIEHLEGSHHAYSWFSEIPITKLHAALEQGESLTSLYMRINDCSFSAEVEREIGDADVLEDPLIRCLFANSFGSFQRAQLKRIKERLKSRDPGFI